MAILDSKPHISVVIESDGAPLTEFPDTDERPLDETLHERIATYQAKVTVPNYIASTTDAFFSIRMAVERQDEEMECSKYGFYIYVDSKLVWTSKCPRPWFRHNDEPSWSAVVWGVKEGKGRSCIEKHFRFVGIETKRMKKIGVIEVRVFRETYGKKWGTPEGSSKGFLAGSVPVAEKAMKGDAKSHGTALDQGRRTARGEVWTGNKKIDSEDYPIVIFRFMYRSENDLKQLGIIDRTPSPSPSPSPSRSPSPERDEDGLTADQRARLEAEMQRIREEAIERAHAEASDPKGRVKKERGADGDGLENEEGPAKKRRKRGPAVMVDLTEDDD